ncbi:MAG: DUF192 domain-containing protein [Actinobacteria bacterium]|nr:MAG: DUF192 domain-containing protein [Actinomycetota bacterium]
MAGAPLARVRTAEGVVLCERCEVPKSSLARMRGLLGRSGLEPGGGMLIDAAPSVMTFFMRFPIDVVFLDRDRKVVGVRHGLRPWRVAGARHAVAALELPAGAAAAAGVDEGGVLVLEDIEG